MATASEKNKSAAKDEKAKAGEDKSRTQQTTAEAEKAQEEVPTSVQERGETDSKAAASGGSVGAVQDGDVLGDKEYDEDDKFSETHKSYEGGEVEGALGTVAERDLHGQEYDVPWAYVTVERTARTSDSDDAAASWTAQEASGERKDGDGNDLAPVALVEVQGTPGQTFRVRELPNRAVAEAAGIDWELWVSGLPVRLDVPDEAPRQGLPG